MKQTLLNLFGEHKELFLSPGFIAETIVNHCIENEKGLNGITEENIDDIVEEVTPSYSRELICWLLEENESYFYCNQAIAEGNFTEIEDIMREGFFLWCREKVNLLIKELKENMRLITGNLQGKFFDMNSREVEFFNRVFLETKSKYRVTFDNTYEDRTLKYQITEIYIK